MPYMPYSGRLQITDRTLKTGNFYYETLKKPLKSGQ